MDLTLWVQLSLFVLLIGLSGFFSSSETSLFSLGKLQIEEMRRNDNPRIGLIERMLSEPRRLIVTILIGNEFVNVAASVISAAIVIRLLGADNKLFNLLIMVPILLLLGEITPKTLAIRNNAAFATFQSRPIEMFAILIKPLRWVVRLFSDWLTTLIVGTQRTPGSIVTEDMVRVLAHEAVGEGVLDKNEAQYVDRVFDYGHRTVGDLKTPRSHIFLPIDMPFLEMVAELRRTRHTKVPIFEGHRDTVLGFLYARDLVGMDVRAFEDQPGRVKELLREPFLVPESKAADELFHTFRRRKLSVALTVDEYGGVTGLITMEDLLECIFGDIPSPSDANDDEAFVRLPDGSTRLQGAISVTQFNRVFQTTLEAGETETIGGLLLEHYGELPPEGTPIALDNVEFEVVEVRNNRIETLSVWFAAGTLVASQVDADTEPQQTAIETSDQGESVATAQDGRESEGG